MEVAICIASPEAYRSIYMQQNLEQEAGSACDKYNFLFFTISKVNGSLFNTCGNISLKCWRWTQKKKHPKFLSPVNPAHLGYRKSLRKNPANLGYKKSLLKNPANLGYKKSLLMDPINLGYQKSFLKNPANLVYKKSLLKNPANMGYQKSLRKNPANLGYQKSLRKYSSLKFPQPKTASANMSL
ncbi:hypothetical protein ACOMHN_053941 [Nucella lapillus]